MVNLSIISSDLSAQRKEKKLSTISVCVYGSMFVSRGVKCSIMNLYQIHYQQQQAAAYC